MMVEDNNSHNKIDKIPQEISIFAKRYQLHPDDILIKFL